MTIKMFLDSTVQIDSILQRLGTKWAQTVQQRTQEKIDKMFPIFCCNNKNIKQLLIFFGTDKCSLTAEKVFKRYAQLFLILMLVSGCVCLALGVAFVLRWGDQLYYTLHCKLLRCGYIANVTPTQSVK